MADFNEGDVVSLKSGGPKMTIQTIPYKRGPLVFEDYASCVWFEGNNLKESAFKTALLSKVEI